MPRGSSVPRWDLESIYPGYESDEYLADREELRRLTDSLLKKLEDRSARKKDVERWLKSVLKRFDDAYLLSETLGTYLHCAYAVDTTDAKTLAEINSLDEDELKLKEAAVTFRSLLKPIAKKLPKYAQKSKTISRYLFFLQEEAKLASKQMSIPEENLAADLQRAGSDAWGRLQDTVSSTLSWPWEGDERKTVVQLRSMAMDPDRTVREKAYHKELAAWKSMEIPLAASLNGVKGFAITLDKRRNYESPLEHAAMLSRITPATLEAQISTMEKNLAVFRRYLKAKAQALGLEKIAFYDLFAPLGSANKEWSFEEARNFIVEQFSAFAWELGDFADKAFREQWIDAEPREGKIGGAFCASVPKVKQSRILANFDGTFDSLFTLSHELGHAYHGSVIKDLSVLNQDYPMTLAETASIFCETIVFNRAMETGSDEDKLAILEIYLQGATQVIVDIYSRFVFEKAVFEKRAKSELSPGEFCELMLEAQEKAYGEGMDPKLRHPYMWAVKPHYYSAGLSFYNFPYAFGMLFGLGLYSSYQEDVHEFPKRYKQLLLLTGQASANDVTREAGFDIEDPAFWQGGIDIIAGYVEQFERLVAGANG
ncbi:MAG: M3 family oligoendopeptidase [Spirochaetales bacterium]